MSRTVPVSATSVSHVAVNDGSRLDVSGAAGTGNESADVVTLEDGDEGDLCKGER
jgi:hypothetical protein